MSHFRPRLFVCPAARAGLEPGQRRGGAYRRLVVWAVLRAGARNRALEPSEAARVVSGKASALLQPRSHTTGSSTRATSFRH